MTIQEAMKRKNFSIYRLSKMSELPYATVNDICRGKAHLEKCSAETVYRIAQALNVTMEELIAESMVSRGSFENFKSAICHRLKEQGDIGFLIQTLENGDIRAYYEKRWYPECLYLLAMLDYISRENDIPLCEDFDDLRQCKLEKPIYPAGILALCAAAKDNARMKLAEQQAIPEFRRFNIMEGEVRNVV